MVLFLEQLFQFFFVFAFLKSIKFCFSKFEKGSAMFVPCSFVFIVTIFEQLGYVFWNPKAFIWMIISIIIVMEKIPKKITRSKNTYAQ